MGYGTNKLNTGAILLVVEAKPYESATVGMPQLLVYIATVHEARKDRVNKSVFGILSNCKEFHFAFLDENKKLFVTVIYLGDQAVNNYRLSRYGANQHYPKLPRLLGKAVEI